jgi:hypothetical protein
LSQTTLQKKDKVTILKGEVALRSCWARSSKLFSPLAIFSCHVFSV